MAGSPGSRDAGLVVIPALLLGPPLCLPGFLQVLLQLIGFLGPTRRGGPSAPQKTQELEVTKVERSRKFQTKNEPVFI